MSNTHTIPTPSAKAGLHALQAMIRERTPLAALQVFHDEVGDVFRINLPGFTPVVMVGPQAARFVLVEGRDDLRWRNEADPVTQLLRHGMLVEDGVEHDRLRQLMNPSLHRRMLTGYVDEMVNAADQILSGWPANGVVDMLVEMRKIALLILYRSLYLVDYTTELEPLWESVIQVIRYISPGIWMLWQGVPRSRYRRHIQQMDAYLYRIIRQRRNRMQKDDSPPSDLLGALVASGMQDDLIRDQLLTMLIAGHDTSTANLAWTLYLLGQYPECLQRVQDEVATVLDGEPLTIDRAADLTYLGQVIQESLRLYPPIHLGSRLAARDLSFDDYTIPAGERVIYSIYLTQRHKDYWYDPHHFSPERHAPGNRPPPYAWLAFGGGPRNCIGAAFGQLEAKIVLARLLQQYEIELLGPHVRPYMGATLEPHPGVRMRVVRRSMAGWPGNNV